MSQLFCFCTSSSDISAVYCIPLSLGSFDYCLPSHNFEFKGRMVVSVVSHNPSPPPRLFTLRRHHNDTVYMKYDSTSPKLFKFCIK